MGRLLYDAERLGRMRIGLMLDAMTGYNEGESERVKCVAELIRRSTWLLWNIQVGEDQKIMDPADMWRFPWEMKENGEKKELSDEEKQRAKEFEERQKKILEGM